MSQVKVTGNASGTGTLTIAAPNTNSDYTLTLPTATGTLLSSASTANFPAGSVLQVVNFQTGALATGTTTIPLDDTIPQNTEGNEYMTLAITPKSASSKLIIQAQAVLSNSKAGFWMTMALFQDSTANALATTVTFQPTGTGIVVDNITYYMTSGTTSSTTFKIRAGGEAAGTTTFNGESGARRYGGTAASSITIWEIAA